jgi:hypothetical protein
MTSKSTANTLAIAIRIALKRRSRIPSLTFFSDRLFFWRNIIRFFPFSPSRSLGYSRYCRTALFAFS